MSGVIPLRDRPERDDRVHEVIPERYMSLIRWHFVSNTIHLNYRFRAMQDLERYLARPLVRVTSTYPSGICQLLEQLPVLR